MSRVALLGLYHPGDSPVHRAPVGLRLGTLAAVGVAVVLLRGPWPALALLGVVVCVAALARLPWRPTLRGLVPVLATAALVAAYQAWQRSWPLAVEVAADLVTVALAATVVTATTPADRLLDTAQRALRPLRRVGVDPDAVALASQLMLRAVPAVGEIAEQTRDAARARGLERSPRALLVPFAVRTVARATAVGEALAARGLGDEPASPPAPTVSA